MAEPYKSPSGWYQLDPEPLPVGGFEPAFIYREARYVPTCDSSIGIRGYSECSLGVRYGVRNTRVRGQGLDVSDYGTVPDTVSDLVRRGLRLTHIMHFWAQDMKSAEEEVSRCLANQDLFGSSAWSMEEAIAAARTRKHVLDPKSNGMDLIFGDFYDVHESSCWPGSQFVRNPTINPALVGAHVGLF